MAACQEQTEQLKERIYQDRKIAQIRRDREVETLNLRIRQAEAQLAAKRSKIEEKAPVAGKVIYRHPSPESVVNDVPVLVFCPPQGVRLSVAVNADQVDALRDAGTLSINLKDSAEGTRSFAGRFLSASPDVSGSVIVDVECDPTPDAATLLVEGKVVKAAFGWRPPLVSLWTAQVSFFVLSMGLCGLLFAAMLARRARVENNDLPFADEFITEVEIPKSSMPKAANIDDTFVSAPRSSRVNRNGKREERNPMPTEV
jgi:hypothetical protein